MIKFVTLIVALSLSFNVADNDTQIENVEVEFSNKAIGIESGQPIFTKDTKVLVSNPTDERVKIFINEDEKEMNDKRVEISGLAEGTYTLMIVGLANNEGEKRTVGFTIQ